MACLNTISPSVDQAHFVLARNSKFTGCKRVAKVRMAFLLKFTRPKKDQSCCTFDSLGAFTTASTFKGTGFMPSSLMICPKYSILVRRNSHFSRLRQILYLLSLLNTICKPLRGPSLSLLLTEISK